MPWLWSTHAIWGQFFRHTASVWHLGWGKENDFLAERKSDKSIANSTAMAYAVRPQGMTTMPASRTIPQGRALLALLAETDLSRCILTGTVSDTGQIGSVGGLPQKSRNPDLAWLMEHGLVDAFIAPRADEAELADKKASRSLAFRFADTVAEAGKLLATLTGPRRALFRVAQDQFDAGRLSDVLGSGITELADPWASLYQRLPMTVEVEEEILAKKPGREEEKAENKFPSRSPYAFEEKVMGQLRRGNRPVAWERLLADFPNQLRETSALGVKPQTPTMVLLAPPGGGKTTVLSWLWRELSDERLHGADKRPWLPVLFRLRRLEPDLAGQRLTPENLRDWLWRHIPPEEKLAFTQDDWGLQWQRWLHKGDLFFLLDGLDEVSPAFAQAVASLVKTLQDSNCPVLATCRVAPFDALRAYFPFPVFALGRMSAQAKETYLAHYPGMIEAHRAALRSSLETLPALAPISDLPLGMSLLAWLACQPGGLPLPPTLAQLYQVFIEKMLTTQRGSRPLPWQGRWTRVDRLQTTLARTAFRLFTGQDDRMVEFDRAQWQAACGLAEDEADELCDGLLSQGLLVSNVRKHAVRHGEEERLAFLHLTFHEHLAALALAQEIEKQGWQTSLDLLGGDTAARWLDGINREHGVWRDPRWPEVSLRLANVVRNPGYMDSPWGSYDYGIDWEASDLRNPGWHEVTQRLAGLLDVKPLGWMIEHLADPDLDNELLLKRCLAVRCAAQAPAAFQQELAEPIRKAQDELLYQWGWLDAKPKMIVLPSKVLHCLWAFVAMSKRMLQVPSSITAIMLLHSAGFGVVTVTDDVLNLLVALLGDKDDSVFDATIRALSMLGPSVAKPTVLNALIVRLGDDNSNVRGTAARALGTLGPSAATPAVLDALMAYLGKSNSVIRNAASIAWSTLGPSAPTPPVLDPLMVRLEDDDWLVRRDAASDLGALGPSAAKPTVLNALIARLGDKDLNVRSAAARALGTLGPSAATPPVLDALRVRLGDLRPVCTAAAEALEHLGAPYKL